MYLPTTCVVYQVPRLGSLICEDPSNYMYIIIHLPTCTYLGRQVWVTMYVDINMYTFLPVRGTLVASLELYSRASWSHNNYHLYFVQAE